VDEDWGEHHQERGQPERDAHHQLAGVPLRGPLRGRLAAQRERLPAGRGQLRQHPGQAVPPVPRVQDQRCDDPVGAFRIADVARQIQQHPIQRQIARSRPSSRSIGSRISGAVCSAVSRSPAQADAR
jgi:hypothetical protein